jgi:tetratricopeptide (TPR) repeat protein
MDRLAGVHADMALALDPSLGLAHIVRARVHIDNWRGEDAQLEGDQALRLSPNDPEVLTWYSWIKTNLDQNEEAMRYLERAVELDPNNGDGYFFLGGSLMWAGRYEDASETLRDCLEIDPRQAICSLFLSHSEFVLGSRETALDALTLGESLLPGDGANGPRADVVYGYGLLGQREDAQRAFEFVTELSADQYVDPVVWAWAYMGMGDYDEALIRLNAAAENPQLITDPIAALFTRLNFWSDPVLEQPEWVEVRNKLRPTE